MIRIVIVDDHPALRTGLDTVLAAEPGLTPVGAAGGPIELWPLLNARRPDVVLLDYHLPGGQDGLQLCRRIKGRLLAPKVLLYSAYAGSSLAIPATVAGADGVVGKGIPARELYEAIRRVARGERVLPPIPPELMREATERLEPDDTPILAMLLHDTAMSEIASIVQLDVPAVERRVDEIIARLRVEVPEIDA
jgi:DNA-binding NarL/FixJ family response regulator